MNNSVNKGIVFAQLKANISSIKTKLPKKIYNLYNSEDKITRYFNISGDNFKRLFYQTNQFQLPTSDVSKSVLGDFCKLDEWCSSNGIGELIKEPYYFDFVNEVFLSWQKDLGINMCDWDYSNNLILLRELNNINHWTENKNYEIKSSISYTELINSLKTPKLLKGSIFQLSICVMNCNPSISNIEVILNFRIDKDQT